MPTDAVKRERREYTGPLLPGNPDQCKGNGDTPTEDRAAVYECCCDECDHYLDCFPLWAEKAGEYRR